VKRVIQGDSEFLGSLTRIQLFEPKDLPNVTKIQKEYKLQPLSAYLGKTAPKPAAKIEWKPWKKGAETTDGSITLYFSDKSPGKDKESNWLPAAKGPFWLVLRTYGPGKSILDKTWKVPPVKQVK
jgi:hypothetical protein